MTRKLILLVISQLLFVGIAYAAPTVVKKADLPANLKGGKQPKNSDGIPGCATGRTKLEGKAAYDAEPMLTWAATHQTHPCFGAEVVYVCRVGKNLSVRCE
jgi:hypothetical protein